METSWGTPKFSNFSKKNFWLLFTSVGMYKKLSKMIGRKSENSGQSIGGCSKYFTPFSETLPIETEKTWTITYNYMDKRVVLHCNEVQVLNVLLSDIVCAYISLDQSKWRNYWENKPTQIKFLSYDTASDTYCMSSNPGKYNGVIDSGE